MSGRGDAARLLRRDVLGGVHVLLAGDAAPSLEQGVGAACAGLGARVTAGRAAEAPPADIDVLVFDGAAAFAAAANMPDAARAGLRNCLDAAWEASHAVANAAFIGAGRPGRIVYLAPASGAGAAEHADAARAGLENLARTLSIEWARHGVTTVAIAPGASTAQEEIAALCAYLATPAGAYFSGTQLDLRGA